jgi:uncharacterized protein (DUF849 family)
VRTAEKVIITCAVTGSVHTPSMSPHLPITPDEIAAEAITAAEAGAAILHLHARNPADGRPSPDPDMFMQFLPRIKQQTDAIINITTGGSSRMSMDERLAAPKRAEPELTSLNMGSMNFVFAGAASRIDQWRYDWEEAFVRGSDDVITSNTFLQIERVCVEVGQAFGTRFEFECYDVGHLYALAHFADRGLVKPPFLIQCIFGILGGIGADVENLTHMVRIADKLFGNDWYLSVLAAGRHQMNFCTQSLLMGGNVRVGLEDSLYLGKGQLAPSNAAQVEKIARIAKELSLEIATPQEARAMLQLKGGDQVGF